MSHYMLALCTMRKSCAYTIRDFANLEEEYNINKNNLKPAMINLKFHRHFILGIYHHKKVQRSLSKLQSASVLNCLDVSFFNVDTYVNGKNN